jgi:AcrR family transcriptional regulator
MRMDKLSPDDGARQLTPQGQDRKAEIVAEAERLFAERGFTNTRMADIAEAAGVTKGLLYWYFENKQALLAEIVLDMRSRLQAAQRAAADGVDDVLARLYLSTVASVLFVRSHQRIYGLITYSGWTTDLAPALHESATAHASDAARLIRRGQQSGVIRTDDDAEVLAHGNAGVVNNYCAAAAAGHLGLSDEDIAHAAARFVLRSLAMTPALVAQVERVHGRPPARRKRGAGQVASAGAT